MFGTALADTTTHAPVDLEVVQMRGSSCIQKSLKGVLILQVALKEQIDFEHDDPEVGYPTFPDYKLPDLAV